MREKGRVQLILKMGGVFALFFIFVFLIQSVSRVNLLCVDPYFHIKRAALIRQGESLGNFPYLPFVLPKAHFWKSLYFFHFLLVPFTWGNLLWGAKVALAVFGGAIFALFYYILKKNQISKPLFWCLFLFFISPLFLFRLQLLRPHLVSIFLLLLGAHFLIFKKNNLGLFWVSFCFVLFYRFPFPLLVLIISYFLACIIGKIKIDWWVLGAFVLGLLAGFFIIPNKGEQIQQVHLIFKTLYLINIKHLDLHFGGELYPLGFDVGWVFITILAILAIVLPILWFNRFHLKTLDERRRVLTLLISTLLFFLMTIKSQRFAEYLVPVSVLLISYLTGKVFRGWPAYFRFKELFRERALKIVITILGIAVVFSTPFLLISSLRDDQERQETIAAGEWLNQKSKKGEIIFHNAWDDFPILVFTNSKGRYILGADPISLYASSPNLYWSWYNISHCGLATLNPSICDSLLKDKTDRDKFLDLTRSDEIYNILKNDFQASHIFLTGWQDSLLEEKLGKNKDLFGEVYRNDTAKIYQLKE